MVLLDENISIHAQGTAIAAFLRRFCGRIHIFRKPDRASANHFEMRDFHVYEKDKNNLHSRTGNGYR